MQCTVQTSPSNKTNFLIRLSQRHSAPLSLYLLKDFHGKSTQPEKHSFLSDPLVCRVLHFVPDYNILVAFLYSSQKLTIPFCQAPKFCLPKTLTATSVFVFPFSILNPFPTTILLNQTKSYQVDNFSYNFTETLPSIQNFQALSISSVTLYTHRQLCKHFTLPVSHLLVLIAPIIFYLSQWLASSTSMSNCQVIFSACFQLAPVSLMGHVAAKQFFISPKPLSAIASPTSAQFLFKTKTIPISKHIFTLSFLPFYPVNNLHFILQNKRLISPPVIITA